MAVVIDVAGATVQLDHPVAALDLEEDPAHGEVARFGFDQGERAAAEPLVAYLGDQVELVQAGLAPPVSMLKLRARTT